MFRCITLACALAHAGSIRIVKTAGTDNASFVSARETQLERSTTFSNSVDSTLKAMDTTQEKVIGDMIGGIATLNFDQSLLPQLKSLVTKGAISLATGFITSVNPLLGVVFSIFSALFGWGGDGQANMVKQILDQVSTMITQSLQTFSLGLARTELFGLLETINVAGGNATLWGGFPVAVANTFPKVFGECWNRNTSTACKDYRTKQNAGAALMLEIQFTNLMVTSEVTLARYDHKFHTFADRVLKAATLTRYHWDAFKAARRATDTAEFGIVKGSVYCGGRPPNNTCGAYASNDRLTKKDFCTVTRSSVTRATVESRQNNCINQHINRMLSNIEKMGTEIMSAWHAARKIERVQLR